MTLPIIRHRDPWTTIALMPLQSGEGFRMLNSYRVQFQDETQDFFLTVPVGFCTDLASIPSIFLPLFKSWGQWTVAAICHDCMYAYGAGTKEQADDLFESLLIMDVELKEGHEGDITALAAAVRLFGRGNFDDPPPDAKEILSTRGYSHQA